MKNPGGRKTGMSEPPVNRLSEIFGLLDAWSVSEDFGPEKVAQLPTKSWVQDAAARARLPTAELVWTWLAVRQSGRAPALCELGTVRRYERGSNPLCRSEMPWWREVALAREEVWIGGLSTSLRLEQALSRQAQARLMRTLRSRSAALDRHEGVIWVSAKLRREVWQTVKTSYKEGGTARMDQHLREMEERGEVEREEIWYLPHGMTCRSTWGRSLERVVWWAWAEVCLPLYGLGPVPS